MKSRAWVERGVRVQRESTCVILCVTTSTPDTGESCDRQTTTTHPQTMRTTKTTNVARVGSTSLTKRENTKERRLKKGGVCRVGVSRVSGGSIAHEQTTAQRGRGWCRTVERELCIDTTRPLSEGRSGGASGLSQNDRVGKQQRRRKNTSDNKARRESQRPRQQGWCGDRQQHAAGHGEALQENGNDKARDGEQKEKEIGVV